MAAYAQFGYGGYPSASQLLSTNAAAAQTPQAGVDPTPTAQQSTLTAVHAPALSPAADQCRSNPAGTSGALSPDALSQNSNTAGAAATLHSGALGGSSGSLEHAAAAGGSCCENGRPIMTDPVSGQTVCSCQYGSARLALSSYSRLPAASVGVYGTPYPSTDQNPYQSIGVDSSAFYSPLSNPYALKDTATGTEMTAWTSAGLQPTTGYYSYDPMSAYGAAQQLLPMDAAQQQCNDIWMQVLRFDSTLLQILPTQDDGLCYGASYDLAARRKNATRESTATLKAWLNEHKKNPYPTKGEKIMLAIITKMTLTQVSTWFANARRRLKKENKMTWEPKNRTDDDDDALVSDDEKEKDDLDREKTVQSATLHAGNTSISGGLAVGMVGDHQKDQEKDDDELTDEEQKSASHINDIRGGLAFPGYVGGGVASNHAHGYHPYHHQHPAYYQHQQAMFAASYHPGNNSISSKHENSDPKNQQSRDCGVPIPATKPKIWSLADTVACKTPPPAAYMGQSQPQPQQQQQLLQHQLPMQQQQQHLSSTHSHMGIHQQHLQHIQQMQQSPHTASNFAATPYSRAPTTAYGAFLGATAQQLHTMNNTLYSSSSNHSNSNSSHHITTTTTTTNNNSNSSSATHTPTTPITTNPLAHQQPPLRHSLQPHAANQRAMGFPEAQPDTPPQTPPNLKVPSVATNLMLTASQAPTTATCRSINGGGYNGVGLTYHAANYSSRYGEYESSSSSSSCSSVSPQLTQNEVAFKPLFKSQQISIAEFVPPV